MSAVRYIYRDKHLPTSDNKGTGMPEMSSQAGDRPVQVAPRIRRPAKGSGRTGQP